MCVCVYVVCVYACMWSVGVYVYMEGMVRVCDVYVVCVWCVGVGVCVWVCVYVVCWFGRLCVRCGAHK